MPWDCDCGCTGPRTVWMLINDEKTVKSILNCREIFSHIKRRRQDLVCDCVGDRRLMMWSYPTRHVSNVWWCCTILGWQICPSAKFFVDKCPDFRWKQLACLQVYYIYNLLHLWNTEGTIYKETAWECTRRQRHFLWVLYNISCMSLHPGDDVIMLPL